MEAPQRRAGGKGLNVARVLLQMDRNVLAIAPAGGLSGTQFTEDLKSSGLAHSIVPVSAPTRRSLAFVSSADGLTSIFNETGAPLKDVEWQRLREVVNGNLNNVSCLVGSGSLPKDAPADFYAWLVQRGRSAGVPVIIDTSGPALIHAARAGADVLKPNRDELLEATGESGTNSAVLRLIELGAKLVVVSSGADGMMAFSSAEPGVVVEARLPAPLQGNPTGAGDAAVAAIAANYSQGRWDPEAILKKAAAWSAAAVLMPVGGEIHRSHPELEQRLIIRRRSFSIPDKAAE